MIDQISELPWFSRKIKISCTFLHLIDILNDLILISLTAPLCNTVKHMIIMIVVIPRYQHVLLRSECYSLMMFKISALRNF